VKKIHVLSSLKRHAINGFTLVELLIVVIILAILAAIVVPQFASTTDDAKLASLDSTLSNMRAAIDLYYQQHGAYPGALTAVPTAACTGGTSGAGVATGGTGATAVTAFQEQLSLYTDAKGGACSISDSTNHKFGPYMKKGTLPPDPLFNVATLTVVGTGNLSMTADGTTGGWKYDSKSGKLILNHTTYQTR
jgi:general secretion pathway protein G